MGMIRIETRGSFGRVVREFSAMKHGHANAVAEALVFLGGDLLPAATALDHGLQADGHAPDDGWDRAKAAAPPAS